MEYILFFVGLGFFLFIILLIERSEERRYQRKLNEAREFGFGGKNQHTQKTLNEK